MLLWQLSRNLQRLQYNDVGVELGDPSGTVGPKVVGDTDVGDKVAGDTVEGDKVVGDTVVGDTVVGDAQHPLCC